MTATRTIAEPARRPPGHDKVRGGFRFLADLIAMTATPWALWHYSILLAIASVVILIGLPAIFGNPGDRPGGDTPIAVPGIVTILIVLIHLT
jgi:hypothetical protein